MPDFFSAIEDYDARMGRHRTPDHATSVEGARSIGNRALNQRGRLLRQYVGKPGGLTDEEAAELAGLQGSCYWKRAGELREDGYLVAFAPSGDALTRKGRAGVSRIVCFISAEGLKALRSFDQEAAE